MNIDKTLLEHLIKLLKQSGVNSKKQVLEILEDQMKEENFSNNIWSLAQRQGTQAREVTVHHLTSEDLFHVGDYTSDREVITKAEYIYFNDYILGKYELSN